MALKYFIAKQPFFENSNKKEAWQFFTGWLTTLENPIIRIVEPIEDNYELKLDVLKQSHFLANKAKQVYISNKPFIRRTSGTFLCFEYELNDKTIGEMENTWLKELLKLNKTSLFTIYEKGKASFVVNETEIIALLYKNSPILKVYKEHGIAFEEWNILLNETL